MDSNQPVERLHIEVSTNAKDALDGLKKLQSTLTKLNNVTHKIGDIDTSSATGNINKFTVSLNHLAKACERIANSDIVGTLRDLSKINFSKLNGLANGRRQKEQLPTVYKSYGGYNYTFGSGAFNPFANTTRGRYANYTPPRQIGMVGLESWVLNNDIPTIVEKTRSLKILEFFERITDGMGESFEKMMHSVGRITFYRAIRFLLKVITQSIKEGINMMYSYSKENGGDFASTMDSLTSTMNNLKASLGSAASEIIMMLQPVMEFFADQVIDTSNKIAESTAYMAGRPYWNKAIRVQSEFAETTLGVTNKLKNTFLGIDEINQLTQKQAKVYDYEQVYFEQDKYAEKRTWSNILSVLALVIPNYMIPALASRLDLSWNELTDKIFPLTQAERITNEDLDNIISTNFDPIALQLTTYLAGLQELNKNEQETIQELKNNPLIPASFFDEVRDEYERQRQEMINAIKGISIYMDGEKVSTKVTQTQKSTQARTGRSGVIASAW